MIIDYENCLNFLSYITNIYVLAAQKLFFLGWDNKEQDKFTKKNFKKQKFKIPIV